MRGSFKSYYGLAAALSGASSVALGWAEVDAEVWLNSAALTLQAAVAIYALWLNRIFGTKRAGWALSGAFILMLAMHLNEAVVPPLTVSTLGLNPPLAYVFSSLLLLLGLSHLATLYRERQNAELEVSKARDGLEVRVRERTAELAQEIEQRKQAELEIRSSQQLYRGLVDSLDGIIFECAADLSFVFVSPQSERFLGYSPDEWLKQVTWREIVHPDDYPAAWETCRKAAKNHSSAALEFRALTSDRRTRWVRLLANVVTSPQGQPSIRGVFLDVTERKQLEDELREAQKMEAVGRLGGVVAHDFNNLLTAIQGYADLLLSDPEPQHTSEYVQEISRAALRGGQLTRQLLAFSRKQALRLEEVDLNTVVDSTCKMLSVLLGEEIQLEKELAQSLPPLQADSGQITQVLMNLALNARDAMPTGGRLSIRTQAHTFQEADSARPTDARPGTYVSLIVSDSGSGIRPEALPHIFEPFFTTKEIGKGTGLGLSIVRSIVKQHGGWIEVDSLPEHGTTFRLFLPATELPAARPQVPSLGSSTIKRRATILLVEDNVAVLKISSLVLHAHGYNVLEANSASVALRLWETHRHEVDLLLTDIVLRDGLSGCDIIHEIWKENPELKAVVMSGYAPERLAIPNVPFLQKPFQSDALLRIVAETLDNATEQSRGNHTVATLA